MQTGSTQVLLNVREPTQQLLDFCRGLGYSVKQTSDPALEILCSTAPTFFITDSEDSNLISWCKFLLQARKNAVVLWPCPEETLRAATASLHAKDLDTLIARVTADSFEIPPAVLNSNLPVKDVISSVQLDRLENDPTLDNIKFNVWAYTLDELLVVAAILFQKSLAFLDLDIPFDRVLYMCSTLRSVYGFRGYHSFRHIVDVVQYVHFLGTRVVYPGTNTPLTKYHRAILIIAGFGHDVLHPGFSTATVKAVNPEWASKYTSLEEFHSKVYAKMLSALMPEIERIPAASADIDRLILATDMAMHRGLMSISLDDAEDGVNTFLSFLIKLADIGNASRVFAASVRQSMCITVEIRNERDIRASRSLPMLPHIKVFAGEPLPKTLEEAWERMRRNQKGFVNNFLVPTLGKLRASQEQAAVNVCDEIGAQVDETVVDFQSHSYPPGQEDLLHYLF